MTTLRFRVVDEKTGEVLFLTLAEMVERGFAAMHDREERKPTDGKKKAKG